MKPKNPKILIKKAPRGISVNPHSLFNTITHALGAGVSSGPDLSGLIVLKKPKERLAFEWVFNAIISGVREILYLCESELNSPISSYASKTAGIKSDTDKVLNNIELYIDKDFLSNPKSFPFIQDLKSYIEVWLKETLKVKDETSYYHTKQFPDLFWDKLEDEFRENRDKYKELEDYLDDTPVTSGAKNNRRKRLYYNNITSFFGRPILNDYRIKLSEIYVDPGFEVHSESLKDENLTDMELQSDEIKGNSIHEYINDHFLVRKPRFGLRAETANILLLLGQPGQGKTSFTYKIAFDLRDESNPREVIFIKLKDLDRPLDFLRNPKDEIVSYLHKRKEISFDMSNAVVILDGLDELFMASGISKFNITDFFHAIVKQFPSEGSNNVIITSRYHYVDLKSINRKETIVLKLGDLNLEKQKRWLKTYLKYYPNCKLTIEKLNEINDDSRKEYKPLRELINQPILLSLIAKIDFDINQPKNRSNIYNALFHTLMLRDWSEDGQLVKFQNLAPKDFRGYIAFVAMKIYQSDYDFISDEDLLEMQETKDFLSDNFELDPLTPKEVLKDVLNSFYFSEVGDQNLKDSKLIREYLIEFYHNSLQEFLVAEKIWKVVSSKFLGNEGNDKPFVRKWEDAIKIFWELLEHKPVSSEVAMYLGEIIVNYPDQDIKDLLADRLQGFFDELTKHQFFYKFDVPGSKGQPIMRALNCFFVYFQILSHLKEDISWIENKQLGDFNFIHLFKINQIHNFQVFNFKKANLQGIDFNRVNIVKANLYEANLQGANFTDAQIDEANLQEANIQGAQLQGAQLHEANLYKANLHKAKLHKVNLIRTNLQGAQLHGANLLRADLREANLQETDFRDANLQGADLRGAKLYDAKLQGANLRRVNLLGADLFGADLHKVNLRGANLLGANLLNANLLGVDLQGANLYGTLNLTIAQLLQVKTLYGVTRLDPEIKEAIKESKPCLFEEPTEENMFDPCNNK